MTRAGSCEFHMLHQCSGLTVSVFLSLQSGWHSSEGKGEGLSELEARALPEGNAPEMEAQASGSFFFYPVLWQPIGDTGFASVL